MNNKKSISDVRRYWNQEACGSHFIDGEKYTKKFFEKYSEFRYNKEHHLDRFVKWHKAKNKKVLEIGLGNGADSSKWAKYASEFHGVDLTEEAVEATKLHFKFLNLTGNINVGNAEKLDYPDDYFDIVYSHGVLHHTVNIDKAIGEIRRVIKDDGQLILMLYAKESFNYWIRIQLYMRLCVIFNLIKSKILGMNKLRYPWKEHIINIKKRGFEYFSWQEFPHHCTDGPNCEIAYIWSKEQMTNILTKNGFKIIKHKKAHFPVLNRYKNFELFLAKIFGFYRFLWCK